jgi:hypothetical protein
MAFGINEKKALLTRNSIAFNATDRATEINQLIIDEIGTLVDAERMHDEWVAKQSAGSSSKPKSIFDQLDDAREARNVGAEKITKKPYDAAVHTSLKLGMDDVKYPFVTTFGEVAECTEFTSSRGNKLYNFTIEVDGIGLAYATGQKALEIGTFVKFQAKHLGAGMYAERAKDGSEVVLIVPQGRTLCYQALIGVKKVTKESLETTILIKHAKDSGALV